MAKCLCCYRELLPGEVDYHSACIRRWFGRDGLPDVTFDRAQVRDLAKQVIRNQMTVTGVQQKLSLDIEHLEHSTRLTIVGLWGRYILKPQTTQYPYLPENEDLTMHLAMDAKISVVPHILIRLRDGELAYLTRRIDRTDDGRKLPMEDMCQLTERLTEHKYRGSYEQIAKAIMHHSSIPGLDIVDYWKLVLFCWITGNSDMHFKNFSLYAPKESIHVLTPAYDLLNTLLVMPQDSEELALTLNGKKSHFVRNDFESAMLNSGLSVKVVSNLLHCFDSILPLWEQTIRSSFLPQSMQDSYWQLISHRVATLRQDEVR